MANREKYAEQILDIACSGSAIAMKNGKLCACNKVACPDCDFCDGTYDCDAEVREWVNSEYVEPQIDWSKIKVDTPILVKDCESGEWLPMHFAKYEDGHVFAFRNGMTSWSSHCDMFYWEYAKLAESEE